MHVLTGSAVELQMVLSPSFGHPMEKDLSDLLTRAGRIVSQMKTQHSTVIALLTRLKQSSSALEKEEVRLGLKQEISTALEADGIPQDLINAITMVFVNMAMNDIELVCAVSGHSIVLHLRFQSSDASSRLREMVQSGRLHSLLHVATEQFIQSQPQSDVVFQAGDFTLSLSYQAPEGTFVTPVILLNANSTGRCWKMMKS